MIKKLDQELKREKSQVVYLRQQLTDHSLLDGLEGFIEDEVFFNKSGEIGGSLNNRSVSKMSVKNKSSETLQLGGADSNFSPFTNAGKKGMRKKAKVNVHQLEEDIDRLKKAIEDTK